MPAERVPLSEGDEGEETAEVLASAAGVDEHVAVQAGGDWIGERARRRRPLAGLAR
jgi:hypothetical protein